jgi:hypothetical protein
VGDEVKQDSSFSEEKEAKRLFIHLRRALTVQTRSNREKVFWFFFSKKNRFLGAP